jgi:hypothetical protein
MLADGKILFAHVQPELFQGCNKFNYLYAGVWHKKEATMPSIFKISERIWKWIRRNEE